MDSTFIVQQIGKCTVVELRTPSLMDGPDLESLMRDIFELVDKQDHRLMALDFERVTYLSSRAIGLILGLHQRLAKLPHSQLVLCGVGPKLRELIKLTSLDKVLTIRPSQKEAVRLLQAKPH